MARFLNKMLNFVGWETEEDEEILEEESAVNGDKFMPMQFLSSGSKKQQSNKVVNLHSSSQLKVVITQPENIEDARDICDHLRDKKPVVINLEEISKEAAQRIIDFLSGSVYALDGGISKVSSGIFLIAPNNVDVMGGFNDELKNKPNFPWLK